MAEENNDLYKTSIAVVDETIRQVKRYLEKNFSLKKCSFGDVKAPAFEDLPVPPKDNNASIVASQIAAWIGKNWPGDFASWLYRRGGIFLILLFLDPSHRGRI